MTALPAVPDQPHQWRVGLIGYGEVGRILAEDLRAHGLQVSAYDSKLGSLAGGQLEGVQIAPSAAQAMQKHAHGIGVALQETHAQVCGQSDLVICAVTASQTLAAAMACASYLLPQAFFLDVNSASPGTKLAAAALIDGAGARYVEAAVMTSLPPHRLQVPMLLGGTFAASVLPVLNQFGFKTKLASEQIGVASATKMSRSIMVKGMEAMVIESLTTARHYGVEDAVIASLYETFPGIDWEKQASYFFQRVIEHGRRRSEEMREVALTVQEAGLTPWLALAAAERQSHTADLSDTGVFGTRGEAGFARSADWRAEADRLLHWHSINKKHTP
jgi:3-hydroxyisobutyrate dehydrogenase-like beta-hydroxyacid dehydrogenase